MGPIETARKEDTRHTIIMAFILLLIGFAGIFFLFLVHAYQSARTTLTRVKAFSDNVVENMPIGLLAIDEYGKIVSFNHTAELVLKLISREVLGKKAGEILPREIDALTAQLKAEKKVIEKEIDCPLKDGKSIPMDVSVSLLEGDNGTFLGHIILFRDLTEIQELKREIERSQRLASLGKLAAGIAHEIRNPLSSIKGFATFFNERFKDMPEYQSTAKIMIQEVDRLNRVITQLLEFARPLEVIKKPVSIRPLIQLSLKIIEREAQSKNIRITTKFSPEINEVHIDQDRFNQVLLNLYLNAVEAMEDGGVLSVALSREDDTQKVRITVSDTGAGIKKEDMVHIFDPYFTTKQSGTGLGLAIVHKIIESHKGEVKIESEFGKGTTVTITLPQY
jgi:two-component system sensor histidine kinase HydH